MELINGIYFIFAFLVIGTSFVTILLLPHTLRFLRISRIYYQILILCFILFLVGIGLQFQQKWNYDERRLLFYPLYSIVFLALYKLSDKIILKKLNRHMYYLTMWQIRDEESAKSTLFENVMQIIIVFVSVYVPMITSTWILKAWHYG